MPRVAKARLSSGPTEPVRGTNNTAYWRSGALGVSVAATGGVSHYGPAAVPWRW